VDGASGIVTCLATTPLQILAPRRRGCSAWAVLASHGGGLVAGDALALDVEVAAGAAALISTQAETKVYRSAEGRVASHRLTARVAAGGALALVPEPVSPFEGARYDQRQVFELAADASLLVVDAVVAGRSARGERWAFDRYHTVHEVRVAGRLAVGEALLLAPRAAGELAGRLDGFDALGWVVALGPAFARCARSLARAVEALPVAAGAPLLAAASPLAGGVLVRCAARTTEALGAFVRAGIEAAGDPLGDRAFGQRW
jgi:urease accessory protein